MKRRTRQALRITLPGLLAILTACTTLGPDHVMPESNVEAQWQVTDDPALQAGMEVNSEWWTLFHDPVLNRLVQMAYEQNLSLQAAGLRIMQPGHSWALPSARSTPRSRKPPARSHARI